MGLRRSSVALAAAAGANVAALFAGYALTERDDYVDHRGDPPPINVRITSDNPRFGITFCSSVYGGSFLPTALSADGGSDRTASSSTAGSNIPFTWSLHVRA